MTGMAAFTATSSFTGTRLQVRPSQQVAVSRCAVRCSASPLEQDSRRQVLGAGFSLAGAMLTPSAWAETLAKPQDTGGETVKAPKSAPTKKATAPGPTPSSAPPPSGLVAKLLAKTEANKELNDRKRLATSYANLASSRTVADGTCRFPNNLFGCDNFAVAGKTKFIYDDREIECKGKDDGKCGSRMQAKSIPSAFNRGSQ